MINEIDANKTIYFHIFFLFYHLHKIILSIHPDLGYLQKYTTYI